MQLYRFRLEKFGLSAAKHLVLRQQKKCGPEFRPHLKVSGLDSDEIGQSDLHAI